MTTRSKSKDVRLSNEYETQSSHPAPPQKKDACEQSALFHQLVEHHLEQPVSNRVIELAEKLKGPISKFQCMLVEPPHHGELVFKIDEKGNHTEQNTTESLQLWAVRDTKRDKLVLYAQTGQHPSLSRYNLLIPELGVKAPIYMSGKCVLSFMEPDDLYGKTCVLQLKEDAVIQPFPVRLKRMLCY